MVVCKKTVMGHKNMIYIYIYIMVIRSMVGHFSGDYVDKPSKLGGTEFSNKPWQ